jgi:uncharacterized protein (DUF2249 family)
MTSHNRLHPMSNSLRFKRLDVRRLLAAGREPFPEIRRTVSSLKDQEGLEIIAPFIPSPLIELLGSEGFSHSLDHEADGTWVTRFWKE